ncbi:hypothetical protein ACHAPU_010807 [Fusarium lateritium]
MNISNVPTSEQLERLDTEDEPDVYESKPLDQDLKLAEREREPASLEQMLEEETPLESYKQEQVLPPPKLVQVKSTVPSQSPPSAGKLPSLVQQSFEYTTTVLGDVICIMTGFFSAVSFMMPTMVIRWVIRILVAIMIILSALRLMSGFILDAYCNLTPYIAPRGISVIFPVFPPGCNINVKPAQYVSELDLEESLDGYAPLVPPLYEFLGRNFKNVQRKADTTDISELMDIDISAEKLKELSDGYLEAAKQAQEFEDDLAKTQMTHWDAADRYLRNFNSLGVTTWGWRFWNVKTYEAKV